MTGVERLPTVRSAATVHGAEPDRADPAELLHEASKLQPSLLGAQMSGVMRLVRSPSLLASSGRAVRRHRTLPSTPLPPPALPATTLGELLSARRSTREFGPQPLELDVLATAFAAAYGVTAPTGEGLPPLRTTPSAGALYPLELFLLARRVTRIEAGIYHYDALLHRLERVPQPPEAARPSLPFLTREEVESAAAIVVVAAVFARSRFKYGLRAYRFTLLEAGHATQNLLLATTALGIGSFVLGGFFDRRLDDLLGLDGVDESSLITICLGHAP